MRHERGSSKDNRRKRYRLAAMPSSDGHVDDLIPGYVLAALEPEEIARVDEHVLTCAGCAEELAESRSTVSLLPFGVPQVSPPPDVKAALFARISQVQQASGAVSASVPTPVDPLRTPTLPASSTSRADERPSDATSRRSGWWGRSLPMVTTVPLVLAVGLLSVWSLIQRDDAQSRASEIRDLREALSDVQGAFFGGDQRLDLTDGTEATEALGRISYRADDGKALFVVSGLADLGNGVDYDVYAITRDDGSFVHAGELGVDGRGNGMTTMWLEPPFDQYGDVCVAERGQDPEKGCDILRSSPAVPSAPAA